MAWPAVNLGLFTLDFAVASNRAVFEPTEDLHGYLAYALFCAGDGALSAALWHHFVRRDGILALPIGCSGRPHSREDPVRAARSDAIGRPICAPSPAANKA